MWSSAVVGDASHSQIGPHIRDNNHNHSVMRHEFRFVCLIPKPTTIRLSLLQHLCKLVRYKQWFHKRCSIRRVGTVRGKSGTMWNKSTRVRCWHSQFSMMRFQIACWSSAGFFSSDSYYTWREQTNHKNNSSPRNRRSWHQGNSTQREGKETTNVYL